MNAIENIWHINCEESTKYYMFFTIAFLSLFFCCLLGRKKKQTKKDKK